MNVAAAIKVMREKGMSDTDILDIVQAGLEGRGKSSGAERQARYRERKANNVTSNVTRDVTESDVTRYGNVTPSPPCSPPFSSPEPLTLSPPIIPPIPEDARKRATRLPEGFPSKAELDWAFETLGCDTDWRREADQFRDRNTATGGTYKDWPAAWRTWCRNARKWQQPSLAVVKNDRYAPFRKILDGTNGNR